MSFFRLIANSVVAGFYSLFTGIWPVVMAMTGTYIYDWKHYPNYIIYIDDEIDTDNQLYVEDVQLDVKYTVDEKGAVLGYIGDDGLIDLTSYVAHVTHEGSIIVWGPDSDPDGMWMLIWPFQTRLVNLLVDDSMATAFHVRVDPLVPSPEFEDKNIRWQNTDRPNHWFLPKPRVTIDVKYNRITDYPYSDTTFWAQNVSRYDDKKFDPTFVVRGTELSNFKIPGIPTVSYQDFRQQIDRASWAITILRRKYENEPSAFDPYRQSTYLP